MGKSRVIFTIVVFTLCHQSTKGFSINPLQRHSTISTWSRILVKDPRLSVQPRNVQDSTLPIIINETESIVSLPLIETASDHELPDDFELECLADDDDKDDIACLSVGMVTLPKHANTDVNNFLHRTERALQTMHVNSREIDRSSFVGAKERSIDHEVIHANNYVDLGKIDT